MSQQNVIQIGPLHYIHVLDKNTNITRLVGPGPLTFIRQEHEQLTQQPTQMIILNSLQFCEITNPIQIDQKTKEPVVTEFGQIKNRFGEREIRINEKYPEPFVLYPGEILSQKPSDQTIVLANQALKLKKLRDSPDNKKAGETYQITGPFVYIPQIDEIIVEKVNSTVIRPNEALKLLALTDLIDSNQIKRKAGEKWLVRQVGNYLPGVFEKVQQIVKAQILTDTVALHLRAKKAFTDIYKIARKAGEEWLVTNKMAQTHIIDINEEQVRLSSAIVLSSTQHCVIFNPYDPTIKTNIWGSKVLRKGESIFFLQPQEELVGGNIQENTILAEDEALLLLAEEEFTDEDETVRHPGEKWMVHGPREFIPPIEITILEHRKAIPLKEDEGVYIRNNTTGEVKKFMGETIMLKEYETLWEKELPQEVEDRLKIQFEGKPFIPPQFSKTQQQQQVSTYKRDKTRVVQYQVQKNNVLQLFNYKTKETRIIFGPALAILEPDEQFTILSLSGGRPKKEDTTKSMSLSLGPDFMSDILIVETSDHAQLSLSLTYSWQFIIDKTKPEEADKLFSVKDFIGDACKQIASRVRGAVSQISFETFHRNSSTEIQQAVFGKDQNGIKKSLLFKTNNLLITSVDIQNVEITDPRTREYLQRSINLAIEISTKSQEDKSKFQAKQLDEQAKGQLQLQSLEYKAECEKEIIKLYELEALCNAVKLQGEALATAKAEQDKLRILGEGQVKVSELQTKAKQILWQNDLEITKTRQIDEFTYEKERAELEIKKAREMSNIEITKLTEIIGAIGKDTIVAISKAGPEMKAKLLKGLGLKGYLVTDGKNPINLFNTANGLMGQVENNL